MTVSVIWPLAPTATISHTQPRKVRNTILIVDGNAASPEFDDITAVTFSHDGKHLAYGAKIGDKWFAVVDGNAGPDYDFVGNFAFSADSKHFAYSAAAGNERFIVVDGKKGSSLELLLPLVEPVFGPNDNRVAYMAQWEENWFVVIDDQFGPFFESIGDGSLVLSADGKRHAYAASQGEKWCVVVNDQLGPLYDGIVTDIPIFSPDGKHLAYAAKRKDQMFLVVDDQTTLLNDYNDIADDSLTFSPDSKHLVYKAQKGDKWFVVVDGQTGPEYDKLPFELAVTNDGIEFLAERDGWLLRCRQPYASTATAAK